MGKCVCVCAHRCCFFIHSSPLFFPGFESIRVSALITEPDARKLSHTLSPSHTHRILILQLWLNSLNYIWHAFEFDRFWASTALWTSPAEWVRSRLTFSLKSLSNISTILSQPFQLSPPLTHCPILGQFEVSSVFIDVLKHPSTLIPSVYCLVWKRTFVFFSLSLTLSPWSVPEVRLVTSGVEELTELGSAQVCELTEWTMRMLNFHVLMNDLHWEVGVESPKNWLVILWVFFYT